MAKTKTCSFCGKESERLWYSNPKCCPSYACKKAYNELKSKKGTKTSFSTKVSKIKPISDKKAKELSVYRKLRDEYMKEHNTCECCGTSRNLTLHHKKTREYHLCDVEVFCTLCFTCHERVHREDSWGRENGYLLNSR